MFFNLEDIFNGGIAFIEQLLESLFGWSVPHADPDTFLPVHVGTIKGHIASPGSAYDIVSCSPEPILRHLGHGNEEFHDTPLL
jgi:hypothetical protein